MIPEERFGRWIAIGVPVLLVGGIAGVVALHMGFGISWQHLIVPVSLYIGLQIGAYICAFWAGKWAREQGRYGPLAALGGFYLWGTGVMLIHYGSKWKILPAYGDCFSFSICMVLVTVLAWFLAAKFGSRLHDGSPRPDK